ncbi:serine/threonine-protein kinase RsbW [Scopulibacillus daqui]|uniref:Serine-protein kinase RsbW n=1 Tax=Scopulibacillus daqui TaxID=1469162 RepID=A0ABS2PYA5_9BACL|nr:anti-sigma B factor RsbW [Scopulibacillus daqui]MBM7644680.1 serine/threonine-protein kinase RsbW [Scopulibacillus daqui]
MSTDSIELTIPAKPEFVGVVRLTISGIANRMGYTYEDIEDIKIAVSEACTNAVNHAYREDEDGKISLKIDSFEDRIEIMVIDRGKSFDFQETISNLRPIDPSMSLDKINEGGLGLFLIETLMDKVTISGDSGVIVVMTKFLKRDEVDGHASKVSTSTE